MVRETLSNDLRTVVIPKGFAGRGPAIGVLEKTDWRVEHIGELVVIHCTQRGETFSPCMEAATAAWLSARMLRTTRAVRKFLGLGALRVTTGILSNAEDDYKLNLEKDR